MLKITANIAIDESEIELRFIRAPGPGGQNVNKVATAAQLRLDVRRSPSLSEAIRTRLLALPPSKISLRGEITIKASRYRTQERNKQDALGRLAILLKNAAKPPKKRQKTQPSRASKERRLTTKKHQAKIKSLRRDTLKHENGRK